MRSPFRRSRSALIVISLVACAAPAGASANVKHVSAYAQHGRSYYFHLPATRGSVMRWARVDVQGVEWKVSKRRLRRAASRHHLKARAPWTAHARIMRRVKAARRHRAVLLVRVKPKKHVRTGSGSTSGSTTTTSTGTSTGTSGSTTTTTGTTTTTTSAGANSAPCDTQLGSFGPGAWPSACWRPYAPTSPWNRTLGSAPRVASNSSAVVSRLLGFGPVQHILAGQAGATDGTDYGHPTYWSQPSDPIFTLHCTESWGRCSIEGAQVHLADSAIVPSSSDHHITIVDQASGWEYDLWDVQSKPRGGGTLSFGWGGKTRIDGDGLNSDANAARYGELGGTIRVEELEAGHIDHALFVSVNCDSGQYVYPASKTGRSCSSIGQSNTNAPAMGTRFQLDMSDAEIQALNVPGWKKTILTAMAHYGMFVGDTGGSWSVKTEGGDGYISFGYEDKWVAFAKKQGVPYNTTDNRYIFNLRDGVDWQSRLRVIDPCVAQGSC